MPYICMIRTDIPDGFLQVLDLRPNTSQRKSKGPPGQTKYVDRLVNGTPATLVVSGANTVTDGAVYGLAAYLLDNVEAGGLAAGTDSLTAAQAVTAAGLLITAMDNVPIGPNTAAAARVWISTVVADSELTNAAGSNSTGSVVEMLRIMAGGSYLLPSGSAVQAPTGTFSGQNGSFVAGTYRHTYDTGAFKASFAEGALNEYNTATWTYNAPDDNNIATVAGAPVHIYADDGTIYTG